MADCILFYGDHVLPCLHKSAGPHRIATELRKNNFTVQLIDSTGLHSQHTVFKKLIDKFVNENTAWVGVSGTFMVHVFNTQFKKFKDISAKNEHISQELTNFMDMCKERNPNVKFIYGGSKKFQLDHAGWYTFIGYADREIVEFTKWCKDTSYKPAINRVGKIIQCTEYEDFSTCDVRYKKNDFVVPGECLPLEVARGCIFKCEFCAFPMNGKTKGEWVKRPNVLREELIRNWEEYKIDTYNFADDTYNDSIDKVRVLHDEVFTKLPFKMKFTSYIRLDLVMRFPETIELLRDSGLESAVCGIETLNHRSAKTMGKGVDPMKQIEFVAELKSNKWKDILVSSGFITGLPNDKIKDLEFLEQFLLSKNNPLDHWMVNPLGIFPPEVTGHINWYSDIDKNYKNYGYEMVGNPNESDHFAQWVHNENNTSWEECNVIAKRILNISATQLDNYKIGGNFFWERLNLGVSREDLFNLSWKEIKQKYDLEELKKLRIKEYYTKFFS
jgi:radical SAM superfamily enzyme YgiQ (UPF0313 family)